MKTLITLLAASLLVLSACSSTQPVAGPTNEQGLATVEHNSFEQLLIRPGVDFNQYRKILIEPVTVSYSEQRRTDSLNRKQSAFEFDDRELELFNKQFVKAVSSQWNKTFGWELTDQPGADVITVKAAVTDLYLYASIKNNEILPHAAATNESSKMVIELSLTDSQSGQLLLQSKGQKTTGWRGNSLDTMRRVSSVRYWNDAYQAFRQWASLLGSQIVS